MLLFGTAGIPVSATDRSTETGIKRIKELGLGCMEIEFVRGVHMNMAKASNIRKVAEQEGIGLTVHAPYFINLNSAESEKVSASKQRILNSARIGALAGAKSVTFHPAYYMGKTSEEVYQKVKEALLEITDTLRNEKIQIDIRPETTGKGSQFGTLDEIINLSQEIQGVKLCIDFSHLYARDIGKWNSYTEFMDILNRVEAELGSSALKDMHLHVSGIEYTPKGERRHLVVQDPGNKFNYKELIYALRDKEAEGFLICESPNLEEDALLFKKIYAINHG